MARWGRFKGCVAGGAIAALVLTVGGGPAQAEEAVAAAQEVTTSTTEAVAAADQMLPLEAFAATGEGFTAADGTVAVDGATVTAMVGAGLEVELSLPVDTTADPQLTDHGTLVYPGESPHLHAEVQNVEDGSARVLTVAEEAYSDTAVHEYSYAVGLPDGVQLMELPTGEVALAQESTAVADGVTAADVAAVDLASVLPDPAEIDAEDVAANTAPAEMLGPAGDELPEGQSLVGVFQAPWAVDAGGQALPTRFEVQGTDLVQVVDTTDAVFPVVSDPLPLVAIALGAAARALAPHAIRAFATQTIRAGVAYTTRGGYRSFASFKNAVGAPRANYQWHHVVEQSTIRNRGWDPRAIHNRNNLVQIPTQVHQRCVNSWMARKGVRSFGVNASSSQTMRQWVHAQGFSKQHQIGVNLLRHCGVRI